MTGNDKLLRVHIQLYESDWNRLLAYYGGQVKRSSVVRELVHNFILRIDAKAQQQSTVHAPTIQQEENE
jgi:hypothetical protein